MYKKRKLLKLLMLFIIIINICSPITYADDEEEEELNATEIQEIVESSTEPTKEPIINSRAAVIYDRTTKKVIWGKAQNEKRAMASTTKIMTAIVVLENSNLTDVVTVSKKAANTGGSVLKINTGDKINIKDLLYGLMLRSRK